MSRNQQSLVLLKQEYTQFEPTKGVFLFSLEIGSRFRTYFSLPYAYPNHDPFLNGRIRYGMLYPITKMAEMHPLVQRFLEKFQEHGQGRLYYRPPYETTYQPYPLPEYLSVNTLPKTRQSLLQRGTRLKQKKYRELKRVQAKQEEIRRKKAGKKPAQDKIYLIQMTEHIFKIGYSTRPTSRLRHLQTSSPHKLQLIHTFPASLGKEAEQKLHRVFHDVRLEGEWFQLTDAQRDMILQIEAYQDGQFVSQDSSNVLHRLNAL